MFGAGRLPLINKHESRDRDYPVAGVRIRSVLSYTTANYDEVSVGLISDALRC